MGLTIALLIRPWAAVLVFAAIIIPLEIAILRIVPRSWRPILSSRVETWQQAVAVSIAVISVAMFALLRSV